MIQTAHLHMRNLKFLVTPTYVVGADQGHHHHHHHHQPDTATPSYAAYTAPNFKTIIIIFTFVPKWNEDTELKKEQFYVVLRKMKRPVTLAWNREASPIT